MEQENSIDNQLLPGYWYRCGHIDKSVESGIRKVSVNTGIGGVKLWIETLRSQDVNEKSIAESIEVFIDGQYIKMNDPRLHHVNLKDDAKKNRNAEMETNQEEEKDC